MKDFKIKRTKLPTIPVGTEFRVVDWISENHFTSFEKPELISYGSKQYRGEDWILAEETNYGHDRYYMFKLKDIERLAAEQSELTELPKYWVVRCDVKNPNWRKVIDYLNEIYDQGWSGDNHDDYYGYDGGNHFNGTNTWPSPSYFINNPTLLTIEEFIELTTKKENMNKIKRSDLQKIHNVACSTWKSKIEKYALRTPFNDTIELNDVEVDAMFNAANNSQTKVLIEVFGERKEKIDWDRIKTGSKVMIEYTGNHCSGITDIDLDKPVDVVFYKTQHLITGDNEFKKEGSHGSYTTFHQNGKYVLFSSNASIDFITKVIEY